MVSPFLPETEELDIPKQKGYIESKNSHKEYAMDVMRVVPRDSQGNPYPDNKERNLVYFNVRYNHHRDLCQDTSREVADKEEWAECRAVLCLPDSYKETGEKTQLIIACHGAGTTVDRDKHFAGGIGGALACIDAGYAALDIDGSAPNGLTKGCPEHLFALYRAYKYAIKHFNLTEQVLVHGNSMGGMTAVNFACTFPSISLALGLYYPRLNMQSFETEDGHFCLGGWDKTTPGADGKSTRDWTAEYFHMEGGLWNEERVIGFEPYHNRSFTNKNGEKVVIPPCPIKIWHGTADTIVDPVITEEYVKAVRRGGCYVELRRIEGLGHKTIDCMRTELRMWFDRFC